MLLFLVVSHVDIFELLLDVGLFNLLKVVTDLGLVGLLLGLVHDDGLVSLPRLDDL